MTRYELFKSFFVFVIESGHFSIKFGAEKLLKLFLFVGHRQLVLLQI